jgi:two-component system, cell cycle sensor histidine kinase and response regulator CckA
LLFTPGDGAYGIVKQSKGAISVYSEPGLGTAFKIFLPRVPAFPPAEGAAAPSGLQGGSETILLAEDNEMVRALACEILKRHGYTVVEARHGADALDIARRYHGPIHLLLTDVVMPEMSGPELVSRLAPIRPQMKIIYMSGYPADAIDHQGMIDQGIEFLPQAHRGRDHGSEAARGPRRSRPRGRRPLDGRLAASPAAPRGRATRLAPRETPR